MGGSGSVRKLGEGDRRSRKRTEGHRRNWKEVEVSNCTNGESVHKWLDTMSWKSRQSGKRKDTRVTGRGDVAVTVII
jgi:hypothetical protein